ncbi:MAG TPA: hypothetical protein VJS69_09405 [Candidatus Krumholzibacteria bacterium]|nr:hypothetical protein [Candidatus Krumholzibacteria bacterium]
MTLDEALGLAEGDYVINRHTPVPYRPIRITAIWVNSKRTIVSLRLASIDPRAWLDARGYDLPPAGKIWDPGFRDWVTREVFAKRRATMERRPSATAPVSVPDAD